MLLVMLRTAVCCYNKKQLNLKSPKTKEYAILVAVRTCKFLLLPGRTAQKSVADKKWHQQQHSRAAAEEEVVAYP